MRFATVILLFCVYILPCAAQCPDKDKEIKQLKLRIVTLEKELANHKHFELKEVGFRTMRFDPSTGDTCIQLTTEEDWANSSTKSQSCACEDAMQNFMKMDTAKRDSFRMLLDAACGIPTTSPQGEAQNTVNQK